MSGMRLSELDFKRLLPFFMRDDEAAVALCKAVNELLGPPCGRIKTIRTWDQIDNLTESECDEMAWEQDVDWYDPESMTLDEKRETIKLAQQIKRKRGTKWSVEQLVSAYIGDGYVLEWWEVDIEPFTEPYTFMALTTNADIDPESYAKFIRAVQSAKNERSHIAGVFYFWQQGPTGIACDPAYRSWVYEFDRQAGTYPNIATIGALTKGAVEASEGLVSYNYDIKKLEGDPCGTYPQSGTIGAVSTATANTEAGLTALVYTFTRCGTRHCGE